MTTPDGIVGSALSTLETHRHVCWLYDTAGERMAVAHAFLLGALAAGFRAIYVCGDDDPGDVREQLARRGLAVDDAAAAGALLILTADGTYLQDGIFSSERMLGLLDDTVEQALDDGFAGIRVCADMSWVLEMAAVEDVLGYESLCNQFVKSCRATGLCLFDRARFPPALLDRFGRTHPWLCDGTGLRANPDYQPA